MPQGSQSAGFTMTEVLRIALGPIPSPYPEPSLAAPKSLGDLSPLTSYMDDVFCKHTSFEDQWLFIKDHLLPRLLWTLMKLSFKKVSLGMKSITAVGWVHEVGGSMFIKLDRASKLKEWPVPKNQTAVRSFLGAVGPCRRWVKNCAEIARPLSRLTGDATARYRQSDRSEIIRSACLNLCSRPFLDISDSSFFQVCFSAMVVYISRSPHSPPFTGLAFVRCRGPQPHT